MKNATTTTTKRTTRKKNTVFWCSSMCERENDEEKKSDFRIIVHLDHHLVPFLFHFWLCSLAHDVCCERHILWLHLLHSHINRLNESDGNPNETQWDSETTNERNNNSFFLIWIDIFKSNVKRIFTYVYFMNFVYIFRLYFFFSFQFHFRHQRFQFHFLHLNSQPNFILERQFYF